MRVDKVHIESYYGGLVKSAWATYVRERVVAPIDLPSVDDPNYTALYTSGAQKIVTLPQIHTGYIITARHLNQDGKWYVRTEKKMPVHQLEERQELAVVLSSEHVESEMLVIMKQLGYDTAQAK